MILEQDVVGPLRVERRIEIDEVDRLVRQDVAVAQEVRVVAEAEQVLRHDSLRGAGKWREPDTIILARTGEVKLLVAAACPWR